MQLHRKGADDSSGAGEMHRRLPLERSAGRLRLYGHCPLSQSIRLCFQCMVLYYRDTGAARRTNATFTLLNDVGKFVSK